MNLQRIIAWMKGLQKVGIIHTIGEDCYWHDVTGVVNSFKKIVKTDVVISPNPKQGCAHIYIVLDVTPTPEDHVGPFIARVKLVDVVQEASLEELKNNIIKYPYL